MTAVTGSFLEKRKIFRQKSCRALLTPRGTFGYYAALPRSLPTHNSNSPSLPSRFLWRKQTLFSGLRLQADRAVLSHPCRYFGNRNEETECLG
jgi:hypothetical protein